MDSDFEIKLWYIPILVDQNMVHSNFGELDGVHFNFGDRDVSIPTLVIAFSLFKL